VRQVDDYDENVCDDCGGWFGAEPNPPLKECHCDDDPEGDAAWRAWVLSDPEPGSVFIEPGG